MTLQVVMVDPGFPSLEPEERILGQAGIEFVYAPCKSKLPAEVIGVAREADAIMAVLYNYIGREILAALPKCRAVVRHGIGVDNIDIAAATDLGILVSNNTSYCIEEVSDLAIALMLTCTRKIPQLNQSVHGGAYNHELARIGHRLRGSTLGLLGLGRVARRVAQKTKAWDLRMLAYDPYVSAAAAQEAGISLVTLDELLQQSDYISIHTPLTPQTRHLIGERELRLMKPNAYLINTARGDIIETDALVKALEGGWIAGVGLDVIENVPPMTAQHPLLHFENAILTPHVAWYSEEARTELQEICAWDVVRVLVKGEKPLSVVNPEVLQRPNCRVPGLR